jgi:hypothetical protein
MQMAMLSVVDTRPGPGGSLHVNAPNVQSDFRAILAHHMEKYVWSVQMLRPNTIVYRLRQPEHTLERRYRMP